MVEREKLLRQLISNAEKACEKKQWKRVKKTFFVLSGVVYFIAFVCGEMNSIVEYLGWLVAAPFAAGLIMYGSILVTAYINHGALEDAKYIASLNGELNATVRFIRRINKENL